MLVSSQTAVISGHGFEIAVRMETKTLKFIGLERIQQIPRNEISQDLMRIWSYNLYFGLFCRASVVCSSAS